VADDLERIDRFVDAFVASVDRRRSTPRALKPSIAWTVEPRVVMSPRDAFFARHATLPVQQAIGRISAELVAPYPPGIPVLAPGERITAEAIDGLRDAMADGTQVRYAADASLRTLQVVDES
jgi:lysine decarboxylase